MIRDNRVLYVVIDNATCRIEESGMEPVTAAIDTDSAGERAARIALLVTDYLMGNAKEVVSKPLACEGVIRHTKLVFGDKAVADLLDRGENVRLLFENGTISYAGNDWTEINLSGLKTMLIQSAGRYCMEYASDMLYAIEKIEAMMEGMGAPEEEGCRFLYALGVRPCGVDDGVVLTRAIERGATGDIYKQVFAIEGECIPNESGGTYKLAVRLYDVTGALRTKEWKEGRG